MWLKSAGATCLSPVIWLCVQYSEQYLGWGVYKEDFIMNECTRFDGRAWVGLFVSITFFTILSCFSFLCVSLIGSVYIALQSEALLHINPRGLTSCTYYFVNICYLYTCTCIWQSFLFRWMCFHRSRVTLETALSLQLNPVPILGSQLDGVQWDLPPMSRHWIALLEF